MKTENINKDNLLFECIAGSKAYGLDDSTSDVDIKGVFVTPAEEFYGLNYYEQISDESNNRIFYELKRFFQLLLCRLIKMPIRSIAAITKSIGIG